ncbi:carboxylesterase/lipase family protein [Nocardia fusca]|uniref:carboxylesterase/lipase family protein n=1 Tax=Nocardia fusca TaxID=941183 RepID=UPI0007A76841|nr:carboxylesterase family protein [Nocardia fusca]
MSDTTVTTTEGVLRGTVAGTVRRFFSVPYAAPPLGAGRFAPPAPREPWTGVLDATRPGPTAPQPRRDGFGALDMSPYFGPGWIRGEDYLTVDIRSPVGAVDCPVMVFVHGGGFVAGSARAPIYEGSAFARDGVVLVTVQYRLGVSGFLELPGAPRNRGVLDIVAALGWVGRNIAAFGGDPGNVTLFGQSAGATIVGAVIASEAAAGLFRRAIVQSGNGFGAFSPEQGARVTRAAAAALAVAPTVSGFASVSDADLVGVVSALHGLDLRTSTDFDPLLGLSPFGLVAESQPAQSWSAAVDLLIGTNTEEGNLYLAPQGEPANSTAADVRAIATRAHPDPDRVVAAYRAQHPDATFGALRAAILGDALFGTGSRRAAAAHGNAFVYEFAWRSEALGGALGAAHAVELPFVFDCLRLPELHGPGGLLGPAEAPARLATEMHTAWVRFARTGDPGWPRFRHGAHVRRFGGDAPAGRRATGNGRA